MTNSIVTVNVTQTVAPAPSTLQRTGAIVTQGGVDTAAGTLSLLTQASDLTPLLVDAVATSNFTWNTGVVTCQTAAPHGIPASTVLQLTISGVTPAAYNGTYTCTIVDADEFTYALVSDPGADTVQGTVIPAAVAELRNDVNTFFDQGANVSVYVLNLGYDDIAGGIASLDDFITTNPNTIYSFLCPNNWDGEADFATMINGYGALTAKTYFFFTTTDATYSDYATYKAALTMVESPDAPATEQSVASMFWKTLSYNPSSSNLVTPLAFSFLYGVTAYPTFGNSAQLAEFKAGNVNYVGTGAEGGISNTILFWGTNMDGRPFNYWYSVDWTQENADRSVANAVINGSNNPAAPLFYNQDGINRLQAVLGQTMAQAVSYGLAVGNVVTTQLTQAEFAANFNAGLYAGKVVVNAVPFAAYSAANPSLYAIGEYGGLSVAYAPQRGFESIIINVNASEVV